MKFIYISAFFAIFASCFAADPMMIKDLCFKGKCPDVAASIFMIGPQLFNKSDPYMFISRLQKLIVLTSNEKCPADGCFCNPETPGEQMCVPVMTWIFGIFLQLKEPQCSKDKGSEGEAMALTEIKKATEAKDGKKLCAGLAVIREKFEGGKKPGKCTMEVATEIMKTFEKSKAENYVADCKMLKC